MYFDLAFQSSLNEQRINETLTCRYITNGENQLPLGPPGVGKTHLAIAFALEALTQGYSVLFLTAAGLVAECHKAEAKGTVSRLIKKWIRPDLIVLDEDGYFPFDKFSANIFFPGHLEEI